MPTFSWVFTTISVKREATFCHSLSFWWPWHIFDSFMSTFCWLFSINKNENISCVMNCESLVRPKEINDKYGNCSARAAVWSYVIASYLGSNRIFKIFNSKWSYDKMLIDWVRSGRTGKYLALGLDYGPRCARSVRPDLEPNIFPSGPPTQSIST